MLKRTRVDPRVELLLANLDYAFDKTAWHGPNLSASVRGVSAADAARSVEGRKTIWEQVLHAAYWKQNVINKLTGISHRFPRAGSVWPKMPDAAGRTDRAWKADVKLLHEVHRELREQMAQVHVKRLDEKLTRRLLGAAAHDLYHAGQVRLLRRMIGASEGGA
jgi:hypothetical protein